MEFIVVKFEDDGRKVVINGATGEWTTNEILQLQAGTYEVALEPPPDYTPPLIRVVLRNTTVLDPAVLAFKRVP